MVISYQQVIDIEFTIDNLSSAETMKGAMLYGIQTADVEYGRK
jgi:hypothetical protein